MTLSVLYPTARHHLVAANINRWLDRADFPDDIQFIVVGDTHVTPSDMHTIQHIADDSAFLQPRPGYVYKLNYAARLATGDIFVECHDDLLPPEHWDTLILQQFENSGKSGEVLRVPNGSDRTDLCIPMICHRSFYDRHRCMTHPELVHLYADDWFTWLATTEGVLRDAPDIRFTHEHPYVGHPEKMDPVYEAIYSQDRWKQDGETFERLKAAHCGIGYKTETLQIHVAVGNRVALAAACIDNLVETAALNARIHVWFDGVSVPITWPPYLSAHASPQSNGIERQRVTHLQWWKHHPTDWLYFTDADAVHAAGWFSVLRRLSLETQALVGGYRTEAHAHNVTEDTGPYLRQKYLPGVSMLFNFEQAAKVCEQIKDRPELWHPEGFGGFDWEIPRILGHKCVVPWQSVVDHVGKGGMHHPSEPHYFCNKCGYSGSQRIHPGCHYQAAAHEPRGDRATHPAPGLDELVAKLWPLADHP